MERPPEPERMLEEERARACAQPGFSEARESFVGVCAERFPEPVNDRHLLVWGRL